MASPFSSSIILSTSSKRSSNIFSSLNISKCNCLSSNVSSNSWTARASFRTFISASRSFPRPSRPSSNSRLLFPPFLLSEALKTPRKTLRSTSNVRLETFQNQRVLSISSVVATKNARHFAREPRPFAVRFASQFPPRVLQRFQRRFRPGRDGEVDQGPHAAFVLLLLIKGHVGITNDCDDELLLLLLLLLPPFSLFFFWALASSLFFFFFWRDTRQRGEGGHISLSITIVFTEDEKVALLKESRLLFVVVREHFFKAASPPRKKPRDPSTKKRKNVQRPTGLFFIKTTFTQTSSSFFPRPRRAQKKKRGRKRKRPFVRVFVFVFVFFGEREREREREREVSSFFFFSLFLFCGGEGETFDLFTSRRVSKDFERRRRRRMELPRGARPPPDEYFASEFNVINNDRGGEETARW